MRTLLRWWQTILEDARFACQSLARVPTYTATVVVYAVPSKN